MNTLSKYVFRLKANKLAKSSFVFISMSFLQKGVGFLLLPLYTAYLSPEQYGTANVINSAIAVYIMLFSFALDDAVTRYYFIYKSDKTKQQILLGSIVIFSLVFSLFASLFLGYFSDIFFKGLINETVSRPLLFLGVVTVATAPLYAIQQKLHIIEEKPYHYTLNTFSYFLINTVLCIIFIVYYSMGARGLLLAAAIVNLIFYAYSIFFLSKRIVFKIDLKCLKEAFQYSLPLLPNRISSFGLHHFNQIYIGKVLTNAAVGIFNIANLFGLVITVLSQSVSMAFQPLVYKLLDKGDEGKIKLHKIINGLVLLYILVGVGLTLISKELLSFLINDRYATAHSIIPILIFNATISAISSTYIYILFYYTSAPKHISISTFIAACINIIGCILLIPILGITGAALGLLVGSFASAFYKYFFALKVSNIRLNTWLLFLLPLISFSVSYLLLYNEVTTLVKFLVFINFVIILLICSKKILWFNIKPTINR